MGPVLAEDFCDIATEFPQFLDVTFPLFLQRLEQLLGLRVLFSSFFRSLSAVQVLAVKDFGREFVKPCHESFDTNCGVHSLLELLQPRSERVNTSCSVESLLLL